MGHYSSDLSIQAVSGEAGPPLTGGGISHYRGIAAHDLLRHAAERLAQRPAVRYGHLRWSYERLNYHVVRCAAMLQRLGLQPGQRVGVLLPNVPEFMVAVNGIWRAGGVVVALSPLMVQREISELVKSTQCRFVICLDMLSHLVGRGDWLPACSAGSGESTAGGHIEQLLLVSLREHLPALHQLGYLWKRRQNTGQWSLPSAPGVGWFWAEIDRTEREWRPVPIEPAVEPAYILPTGGTTADPKAVVLSHENLVANAWQQYVWTKGLFGSESMMGVLPFFHSYGLSATVLAGTAMGATLSLHHRFSTAAAIRMIETDRPTVFHAVPAMLAAMNERLRKYPADLSSLRWVISGGAPLEVEVAEEFAEHSGALVVEGYGLSEASPVTHVGPLYQPPRYGTIGMTLPETEARIVRSDPDGRWVDVGLGEVGELVVRGPQVMLGYWQNEAATREAMVDGWLRTGDLAAVDSDGYYRIVGRQKDLIITSGFNVYPAEVEDVLCQVPGVAGAAVVGVPDGAVGERVKAFIELEPGAEWDEAKLQAACAAALAKHKRPKLYERFEGQLPRNFLGKLIRRHLREEG